MMACINSYYQPRKWHSMKGASYFKYTNGYWTGPIPWNSFAIMPFLEPLAEACKSYKTPGIAKTISAMVLRCTLVELLRAMFPLSRSAWFVQLNPKVDTGESCLCSPLASFEWSCAFQSLLHLHRNQLFSYARNIPTGPDLVEYHEIGYI